MQPTNFWTDDFPRPADLPTGDLPERVDVAVVGGGYTGLHAALALGKAGATVAVLEQETIGWGASSRNGGMALTGLKQDIPPLARAYGLDTARHLWAWSLAASDHLRCTLLNERIDCDYTQSGHLLLASKPKHYHAMLDGAEWMARTLDYHDLHPIPAAELDREIGSSEFHGGLIDGGSGGLHPAKYVYGLAAAAARHGATLVEQAQVTGLTKRTSSASGGFALSTSRGEVRCREVLLATNGYTGRAFPAARRGIFPVGSYIIVTEPLPLGLQYELIPHARMCFDSKHFLNYFRLTPDGRLLFGGRHDLSTGLDLVESANRIRRRLVEVFPQLMRAEITHTWTGKLGVSFDLMPHADRLDGVHYAYGYAGHGVALAGLLGKEMGEWIAGVGPRPLVASLSHPRPLITPYDNLYLPLVAAYFRALDRWG